MAVRPKPERRRLPTRTCVVASAAAGLVLAATGLAQAQGGPGAERYEVTITPPRRPGSEASPDPSAAAPPGTDAAPASPGSGEAEPAGGASASPASAAPAGVPAPVAATGRAVAAGRSAANGPLRTLQVGAFRERSRATSVRDSLAASFEDVRIVEVQSGGDILYRVNVGQLPRGAALAELKRRLVSAGYAAFELASPPAPAN